jgi:hypothetical protein
MLTSRKNIMTIHRNEWRNYALQKDWFRVTYNIYASLYQFTQLDNCDVNTAVLTDPKSVILQISERVYLLNLSGDSHCNTVDIHNNIMS